jgi:hypothetical protein
VPAIRVETKPMFFIRPLAIYHFLLNVFCKNFSDQFAERWFQSEVEGWYQNKNKSEKKECLERFTSAK